ncbi:MAG TPA: MaoC/PaaZ C-terminal domain-containing protein [Anaerolineae bacterium]|nr:MaoC/PaaZ C-terminal domain-containing protein [Anaerolineae bacterium]
MVKPLPIRTGLTFEEYDVGQTLTTPARTVTEADIVGFCALSGDWNPLHSDAEFARRGAYGQRVAHGMLVMSIGVALVMRGGYLEGTAMAFRDIADWKFSRPVFIGDTVYVHCTITETRPMPRLGGGLVTMNAEIRNQRDEVVQRGAWGVLVRSSAT